MKPRALILRSAGANCDLETAWAFERVGALSERIHVNQVIESPGILSDFQILAIPGGFSYGDDIAAGKILASRLMHHLAGPLKEFVAAGKPVIGICNGFQVLVKTDLLPGRSSESERADRSCTLTNNSSGRFVDRWIHLLPTSKKCIWTAGLGLTELPIAHGEGRFVVADTSTRRALLQNDQIALIYARPDGSPAAGEAEYNPNGSDEDIAGICDATGLVFGLMPHPERHINRYQHPLWTSNSTGKRSGSSESGGGLKVFQNAVDHVLNAVGHGI